MSQRRSQTSKNKKKSPIIRVSKDSWPFPEKSKVRLEFLYHIKTLENGRSPTIRAIFRDLTPAHKPLIILDMDWLSFPRLIPGRVFTQSPHLQSGSQQGDLVHINITGAEQVSAFNMSEVQVQLKSTSMATAFEADPALADCKIFHWIDDQGSNYWLPIMEVLRSIFAKSPEMARALLLYNGWRELVEGWNLEGEVMEIFCTAQPKVSDIHRLAWIASEPSLLQTWNEIEKYIPNMKNGISPSISWPFDQRFTLHAEIKEKDGHYWITEICNFVDWPRKYNQLYRHHPALMRQQVDSSLPVNTVPQALPNDPEGLSSESSFPSEITVQQSDHAISRPKKFIHIQTNQYDGIDSVATIDEQIEKQVAPCRVLDTSEKHPSSEEVGGNQDGALSDRLSAENDDKNIGIGTKEQVVSFGMQGLEHFAEALQGAVKELKQASLHWPLPAKPLRQQKPKDCGSRWFIEMEAGIERLWCMACIQYGGKSFYFLEVGRLKENDKLSLSTVLTDHQPNNSFEWIKQMIKNNGHWKKDKLDAGASFLPHRYLTDPKKWGVISFRENFVSETTHSYLTAQWELILTCSLMNQSKKHY